jgi:small GTP-binding protein
MPSNVTYEFAKAREKYEAASTPYEKLAALEEMRSTAPSHKGAERLRAEITRKIARVRSEIEREKKQASKKGGGSTLSVKKDGVGQVVLVGLPNSGKSTFFNYLTGLKAVVGDWEFSTTKPEIGMVNYKDTNIQLVDLPAIIKDSHRGKANGKEILAIIRNADLIVTILNAKKAKEEYEIIEQELKKAGILLNQTKPNIKVTSSQFPGISITGKKFLKFPQKQLVNYLKGMGLFNSQVILREETTMEKLSQSMDERIVYKKGMVVYNCGEPKEKPELPKKVYQIIFDKENKQQEVIAKKLFDLLEKVYIYTKRPGKAVAFDDPLVLKKGTTVSEAAKYVHKEIAKKMKFAKVWGSTKFDRQRVGKNYKVKNGDIVEFNF